MMYQSSFKIKLSKLVSRPEPFYKLRMLYSLLETFWKVRMLW